MNWRIKWETFKKSRQTGPWTALWENYIIGGIIVLSSFCLSVIHTIHYLIHNREDRMNKNYQKDKVTYTSSPLHTVSFDWFLSSLEWILNLEFCLLKLLIFYQKLLWNIRSRLNSSIFWDFRPVFSYVWVFVHKKWRFWSNIFKYRLKNSKYGRVKPRSDIP